MKKEDRMRRVGEPASWPRRPAAPTRRRALGVCVAGLCAVGCGALSLSACRRAEPVRVGFIGGLSGRVADLGVGGRNGAQLAIDDLNAAGGIHGRPVELLVRDDEQNGEIAQRRLQELIEAGAELVIGPMTSSVAVALTPLATERGIVLISPTATTHELSGKADALFRVVSDALSGGAQQSQFLHQRGLKSLVTVADLSNRAFSQSWAQGAEQRLTALGARVLPSATFTSAPGMAYGALAERALQGAPAAVIVAASPTDTAMLVQQCRQRSNTVQLATSPWAGTEQLLQMGGRAVEGCLVPQYHDLSSQAPAYLEMLGRFQKRFGTAPGFPGVNAYDALMLGAEALRRQAPGQPLREVMRSLRAHNGLQRSLVLDANGDCASPLFLTWVRGGKFVSVGGG